MKSIDWNNGIIINQTALGGQRMLRLMVLSLTLLLLGCSVTPPNEKGLSSASTPLRWQADPDCIKKAAVSAGMTRDSLGLACENEGTRKADFIGLTLSGGGVKAAVFSAEAMFYLQALGLLQRTDVISSVSGGSFTAAIYGLSCDPDDIRNNTICVHRLAEDSKRLVWKHDDILDVVGQGYRDLKWQQIAQLVLPFAPGTISSDRFASYIDSHFLSHSFDQGQPLRFKDLNPRRPYIAINSSIVSANRAGLGSGQELGCGSEPSSERRGWLRRRTPDEFYHFAYTDLYFNLIGSNHADFPVSQAVAASAAFPVLIDEPLLRDYCRRTGDDDIIRLMDGGINDNQGIVEIYHILSELAFGERRSDISEQDLQKARMRPGDAAFIFVINSSVTDTTGPVGAGSGQFPLGALRFISGIIDKVSDATNVYGATNFNLRRNLYLDYLGSAAAKGVLIKPIDIGLDKLDQYPSGGAIYNLWKKAGILDTPGRPENAGVRTVDQEIQAKAHIQGEVSRTLIHNAANRHSLSLSDYHPQCYFDIRSEIDSSLVSIPDDTKACLREAARWSVALSAQEFCSTAGGKARMPAGLQCHDGVVRLVQPDVLGRIESDKAACAGMLKAFFAKRKNNNASPDPEGCSELQG